MNIDKLKQSNDKIMEKERINTKDMIRKSDMRVSNLRTRLDKDSEQLYR